MNTLIANQYGRVQGEAGGCGLTLCVTAQTPRRESVELQTRVDSIEQQLHLLAILRAVERRIEQFRLNDAKRPQAGGQECAFDNTIRVEGDLFTPQRGVIERRHPTCIEQRRLAELRVASDDVFVENHALVPKTAN